VSIDLTAVGPGLGGSAGINVEFFTEYPYIGFFDYRPKGKPEGYGIGASLQFNVARGWGAWTGDFENASGGFGIFSGGYFESPYDPRGDPGWAGLTFGIGPEIPSPGSLTLTTTTYVEHTPRGGTPAWARAFGEQHGYLPGTPSRWK
jgi:hypothetical protein